jgi:hypothetical protein
VNARQLAVLEWIVEGCPAGVMTGTTRKATALALQTRRLAVVTKRCGVWTAEATAAAPLLPRAPVLSGRALD